jgi:hypothetical protein
MQSSVLATYVVPHSQREEVTVITNKKKKFHMKVNECDVWLFFGDTILKGKKKE